MKLFARIILLAYPKSFRRDYGAEWVRTIRDLRIHSGSNTARLVGRLLLDVLATAPRMRWENLMSKSKTLLTVLALIVGAAGLMIGSPAIAVPVIALVAIVAIQASRHDQPIAAEITMWAAHWYLWIAASAACFTIGFGALLTNEDGDLAGYAWATWILSWLAGTIIGVIGVGLGTTRLIRQHRNTASQA